MKFGLFKFVAGVLQVFAWIVLVVGVILAILSLAIPDYYWVNYYSTMPMRAGNMLGIRLMGFLIFLIGAISSWAFLLTIAGILVVLISIDQGLSPRYGAVTQPAVSPPGPVCPNCGAPVKPGDRFCQNCGAKLE